ncbi:lytic transglycosylase domain-containing protein [Acetobacter sp. DsW_063]|uniref:lytic transglycosylase domain-containing protein n=1 Tax=Acetobacter sp. DsW_063 TaxID=1514894 RepID=UPI001E59A72B|nr:lytic transglycosylase domain-containing protein [Acetobacter sp. DsW_063]
MMMMSGTSARAESLDAFIAEAATRAHIPANWIAAVLRAESAGDVDAVSSAGAMGLMQLMPDTWRDLRTSLHLGSDPFDPRDNIVAGAAYLRVLHDRYGDAGFLAAYNAGPSRYDDHLATGRALPVETLAYVATVNALLHGDRSSVVRESFRAMIPMADWRSASLFIVLVSGVSVDVQRADFVQPNTRPVAARMLFAGHFGGGPAHVSEHGAGIGKS